MCEMSAHATRGVAFKCMGSGGLRDRDLLWWLR